MNHCLLLLLLSATLALIHAKDSGYDYKRPVQAFTLPPITKTTPTVAASHQEKQSPRQRGHVHRHKLRAGFVKPKQRKHLAGDTYCHDDKSKAYNKFLLAQSALRPEERRLTSYTEVKVGSEHFEPAATTIDQLKKLLKQSTK